MAEPIKQRAIIRSRLTLFENYLQPLLDIESKETDVVRINELQLRLTKIQELSYKFDEIQNVIEDTTADSDKQILEREVTENKFFNAMAKAQYLLDKWSKKDGSGYGSCVNTNSVNFKLPAIKISCFDGNPRNWITFKDTYLSLIHNNDDISDVSKFHYLKSYLEGIAGDVISSITISANNYSTAWSVLCERYDNKRLLINEHLKCLFSIEPLVRESAAGLRNLIDTLSKNLSALNSLSEPTHNWDTIIIYMASSKLDPATARTWEEHRSSGESPTLKDFYKFLGDRATVLETMQASKSINKNDKNEKRHSFTKSRSFITTSSPSSSSLPRFPCASCKQNHRLYDCPKFKSLSIEERNAKVYQWNICSNCLRSGHLLHQCRLGGCRICRGNHNTLLHKQHSLQHTQHNPTNDHVVNPPVTNSEASTSLHLISEPLTSTESNLDPPPTCESLPITLSAVSSGRALLPTALVKVTNNGTSYTLRALLDSGSQSSFISAEAQRRTGACKKQNKCQLVSGLNQSTIQINEHCDLQINSMHTSFNIPVKCYIVPMVTDNLPNTTISVHDLIFPKHVKLADPSFYKSAKIDLLLGADVFWDILKSDTVVLSDSTPAGGRSFLRDTHLGWIVAGPIGGKNNQNSSKIHCHFSQAIKEQLSKFWELEEIPSIHSNQSIETAHCEKIFNATTTRDKNGRFCVQMPLCESPDVLGDSFSLAVKRLHQMEIRMSKNQDLKQKYTEFIKEYESLEHLTEITEPSFGCYLPHHAVLRQSSETTKLRVVFNASAKTSSGKSLNDIQVVGPVVQDDLFSILLRFRQHMYVIQADIEKMYRQILIEPSQRYLQLILWRDEPNLPIKILQLNTVTYGTASAPYLSTRCLLQLSKECPDKLIAKLIREDFYVDDFLSGADTEAELRYIVGTVTETLSSACLPLRKFRTNLPAVLDANSTLITKDLSLNSESSVLGLKWDPSRDIFKFPISFSDSNLPITKRTILSQSAQLFDPLGLLSLCTIIPKLILQQLWLTKLDWDDSVPKEILTKWIKFKKGLSSLAEIQIPRFALIENNTSIEIHAFSDASQQAYASCIYLRSINTSGTISVKLLCAKSKVAPLKPATIPRLELCGALLSARLCTKVKAALRCQITNITYWTDSSVVLGWVSTPPRELKPFVSNRVAEIQELTSRSSWKHVAGQENPADLASRGLEPNHIHKAGLWWNGPPFLSKGPNYWPQTISKITCDELPERNTSQKVSKSNSQSINYLITSTGAIACNTLTTMNCQLKNQLINWNNFSKLTRLQRSTAYVLRFINNLKQKLLLINQRITADEFKDKNRINSLSVSELKSSLLLLLIQHQLECFSNELSRLQRKQPLSSTSRILSLNPFIDEHGLIRVGGRIQNSTETYNKIHPILVDSSHKFTQLLFAKEHIKLLHCGPQLLLASIRNEYWPLKGRVLARTVVNQCKPCKLLKSKCINPLMGNLPAPRVTPSLPFQVSGVDFAGPFLISDRKGRGCKISKCYLCLFICFATKALHLEVASDLTTDVFILCLRRFISRRGKPDVLYCDNGTNFVGANNEISNFIRSHSESMSSWTSNEGIQFKFSPAYSPHFGGLWEAAVKSAKFHIVRILGDKHLTYEELSTLFTQIEAILNSRPLSPLSSDPNDLEPLTPGHFLIGRALITLPSPALYDAKETSLSRYQLLEKMRQNFWERWRTEVLSEMQQRTKWKSSQPPIHEGDMVVIREPNAPPLKWRMGRIQRTYPGADGVTRVVDVLTTRGVIRRAVSGVCPLHCSTSSLILPRKGTVSEGGEDVGEHLHYAAA